MANILYRGSSYTTANIAGSKNAPLTNDEIDRNFYSLDLLKFDKAGGTVTGSTTFGSDLTVSGNLTVNGTTTTVNTVTLSVKDINIELGVGAGGTNAVVDGAGLTVKGAGDKTFNWVNATAAWTSSEHLRLAAGKQLQLLGSSSGVATITAPAAAGTPTLTLPTASGTLALTSDIGNGAFTVNTGSGLTGGAQLGTANQSGATSITISHAATSSQASVSYATNTFVSSITLDSFGHITAIGSSSISVGNGAFTVNTGTGLTGGAQLGTANQSGATSITISHADTSAQASVDNSNGTVIQDITLDDFGHITAIGSVDLDSRYDARYVNVTGDTMTGLLTTRSTVGTIGVNTQGTEGLQVVSDGTGSAAYINFHRPGAYAVRFGLDTDNILKVGGWSMGNAAYTIYHSGNLSNLNQLTNGPGYITTDGRAYPRRSDGGDLNFYWSGQGGQPTWLWGGSDGTNMYVYNPSNFSVNYATGARRLYRSDSAVDTYNVQSHWDGSYWELKGYNDSTYHAGCKVAYATSAGSAGSAPASDVYAWAKAATKPSYTYSEVGAAPASHTHSYLPLSGGTLTGDTTLSNSTNSVNSQRQILFTTSYNNSGVNSAVNSLNGSIKFLGHAPDYSSYDSSSYTSKLFSTVYSDRSNLGGLQVLGTVGLEAMSYSGWSGAEVEADAARLVLRAAPFYLAGSVTESNFNTTFDLPRALIINGGRSDTIPGTSICIFQTNGTTKANLDTSGNFVVSSNITAYGSPSDRNLKENIQPLTNSLEKVKALQGVSFDWKKETAEHAMVGMTHDIGLIAQNVQEVFPELVREGEDGFLSLRDRGLVAVLIEAIKELNAKVEDLQNQLANK
jgi:hypothetical protein